MAITKDQKQTQLTELSNQMREASSIAFAKYWWLTVKDLSDLRNTLRESWASLKVIKKTLIKRAAKDVFDIEIDDSCLDGQICVVCSKDELTVWPKIIKKIWKDNENLTLEWWILDWKSLSKKDIIALASLPSKEELIAKMLWSLNSPISWFASVWQNVISGFVRCLNAHRENQS